VQARKNHPCRTDSTPVSKVPLRSRCHASCTFRSSSASPLRARARARALIILTVFFPPLAVPPVRFFSHSFFHESSSPSASEESSRPSHVRGNPANFVEFPRNELKETGAGDRERWTRFGRIVTYDASEDDEDDGVGTYRTSLIAREAANRSAPRTSRTSEVLTAPSIIRDNI